MFFKPKQTYLAKLTTAIEYYQQVRIIHLVANFPNAIFEEIENSLGVIDKPIFIIRYQDKNYRWTHPRIKSLVESGDILQAISLARKELKSKLQQDLTRQQLQSKQAISTGRREIARI